MLPQRKPGIPSRPRTAGIALAVCSALLIGILQPVGVARSADLEAQPGESAPGGSAGSAKCKISDNLVPRCGAWFGAISNPRGSESWDTALMAFEARIGRTVDIAHYYMRGQDLAFPTNGMIYRANEPDHERLLLINWRPELTWRAVAEGAADTYLRSVAEQMKTAYNKPFFLSLHAEMERDVNLDPASGMTPTDFRQFFQHTVETLRENGARKFVPVVVYTGAPHWGDVPWWEDLYPGDKVVDWIAEDPYAFGPPDDPIWRSDFAGMVNRVQIPGGEWPGFYEWATKTHPSKPVMLAEFGVDDVSDDPTYKPEFFDQALEQLRDFPRIKALVYWDDSYDPLVGETRADSSSATLREFKGFVHTGKLTRPGEAYLNRPAVPE